MQMKTKKEMKMKKKKMMKGELNLMFRIKSKMEVGRGRKEQ